MIHAPVRTAQRRSAEADLGPRLIDLDVLGTSPLEVDRSDAREVLPALRPLREPEFDFDFGDGER